MKYLKKSSGFSILETLLTTIVVMGILLAVFNLFEDYAEKTLARSTAKYLDNVSLAVEEMISNKDYFNIIYDLADAETNDILELTLNDLINGFGLSPNDVPASTVLNAAFRQETPLKTGVNVMIRVADNTAITTDSKALEIIVATDARVIDSRARAIAHVLGAHGGHFREGGSIQNSFSSWRLAPALFDDSTWGDTITASPPSQDDGTYIVHYTHKSFEDITGDYLYRDRVAGSPELNRMHTDINLGGNNILGADNVNASGNLNLGAKAIVKGSMNVGNVTLTQSNFTVNNQMTTQNALIRGNGTGVRGNFSVEGGVSTTSMTAKGVMSADSATFENGLSTTGDLRSNGLVQFSNGFEADDVNATGLTGSHLFNVTVGESVRASDLTLRRLNVGGGGNIGTIDTQVSGDMGVTGSVTAPNMGFGNLTVTTFGDCDQGC
jgi:hypothetical protein